MRRVCPFKMTLGLRLESPQVFRLLICNNSKINFIQVYFQAIFTFIYRILCDRTCNRGILNSHINDIMCHFKRNTAL